MTDAQKSWNDLESWLRDIIKHGPIRPNLYESVPDLFSFLIRNLVLHDDPNEKGINFVHYTKWENALNMFYKDQRLPALRMYNLEHSNDPNEGKIKPPEWANIENHTKWIDEVLEDDPYWADPEFGTNTYGCSFSSGELGVEDDLMYWRMYGNDGEGCSLRIVRPTGGDFRLYKVRYRDASATCRSENEEIEDKEVADRLRRIFATGEELAEQIGDNRRHLKQAIARGLRQILYGFYHLVKDKAYSSEMEWRAIRVMPELRAIQFDTMSTNPVKRYIDGPFLRDLLITGSEITIGPTVPNRAVARFFLEQMTKKHGMAVDNIKYSRASYRRV